MRGKGSNRGFQRGQNSYKYVGSLESKFFHNAPCVKPQVSSLTMLHLFPRLRRSKKVVLLGFAEAFSTNAALETTME